MQKLLDLGQEFSSITGYKVNAQKSVEFLYINNGAEEKEIKVLIPFTIAPKPVRYLGIKLTKEIKDLYSENYRTLMKGIEEDTKRNGKTFHAHGLKEKIPLKCLYHP